MEIVHSASAHEAEGGQIPVVIEQQMKFDRSLGSAELRPVEDRKAKIDHRTVQAEELVFESELAGTHQGLTAPK